jgi:5'-3' exonuclease
MNLKSVGMCTFHSNVSILCTKRTLIFNLNVIVPDFSRETIIDFVCCCFIMGNDYLPKIREFVHFQ